MPLCLLYTDQSIPQCLHASMPNLALYALRTRPEGVMVKKRRQLSPACWPALFTDHFKLFYCHSFKPDIKHSQGANCLFHNVIFILHHQRLTAPLLKHSHKYDFGHFCAISILLCPFDIGFHPSTNIYKGGHIHIPIKRVAPSSQLQLEQSRFATGVRSIST